MGNAGWPEWVERVRTKGVAIERRGDHFYATRVRSVWDPAKGRARKVTEAYLGRVTPEGIVPPRHKRPPRVSGVLEAGNLQYLARFAKHLEAPLREYWPEDWQTLLAAGVLKLCYREPLKRLELRYDTSWACRLWPDANLDRNNLTRILSMLGREWDSQRSFFEHISKADSHVAIDLTQVFSDSENISWLEKGYNAQGRHHDQLELLLMWGTDTHTPGFLKLLPGAVASAQSLVNAITESRLRNVVLMGDKAFFSRSNVRSLEDSGVQYALALTRDLPFLRHAPASKYSHYFLYREKPQWWREYEWEGRRIVHYLDKTMAAEEEGNMLARVEAGKERLATYRTRRKWFGTLPLLTNTSLHPKEAYALYKQRREIEQGFDSLKNTLQGDKTWMQSRESFQGYLFLLFIALHVYSQVLNHLTRKSVLEKWSVHDVLWQLSKIYVVRVDGKDVLGEVTAQTQRVVDRLEVPITDTLGS